ncbi:MAG TPA: DUF2202 domain-containing protein [Gammaproteobacteria bacterium]|nr:DUF2202 domain-containing protein [Gammaproteobacteria bacterium]
MKKLQQILRVILPAVICLLPFSSAATTAARADNTDTVLDFSEQTHLVFICEEEKLVRDVYRMLARRFPEVSVLADMEESQEHNRCAVQELLKKYRVSIPRVNDNVGVFSWGIYGRYFMEKYMVLTNQGSVSPLNALYVAAFMEELTIQEITECPKVIVDISNGIGDISACGMRYTDNPDVRHIYDMLLESSRAHLRLLVGDIEQQTGTGTYQAQVLQQADVERILSRQQLAQP